jgi:ankyrin repeat protein
LALAFVLGCEHTEKNVVVQDTVDPAVERTRLPSDDEIEGILNALVQPDLAVLQSKLGESTDPDFRFRNGMTLLSAASGLGKVDAVKYLLEIGADVNIGDDSGVRPLHIAAFSGKVDVVLVLLEAGADLEARDYQGTTPLALAACGDSRETLELLLDQGADMDAKNLYGLSPLGFAVENNKPEMAEIIREFQNRR